ncbi:MAG: 4Fe-4S cluster-binding domain-containing protein [Candidatus Pacebacteria bacterium]|nr:4Fe-4S cluster-binding domain-containing protein [Candidatus Paceibacterota bacterium]
MKLITNQYSVSGKYLEIFVSGCKQLNGCRGTCHNHEAKDFSKGKDWELHQLKLTDKILTNIDIIDLLIITGGEPLDQKKEDLLDFIKFLKTFKIPICVFTSYSFNKVSKLIKENVDLIKCGAYDERFKADKDVGYFTLATTNQNLYRKELDNVWSCI